MKIKVMYRAQCLAAALGYGPEYDAENIDEPTLIISISSTDDKLPHIMDEADNENIRHIEYLQFDDIDTAENVHGLIPMSDEDAGRIVNAFLQYVDGVSQIIVHSTLGIFCPCNLHSACQADSFSDGSVFLFAENNERSNNSMTKATKRTLGVICLLWLGTLLLLFANYKTKVYLEQLRSQVDGVTQQEQANATAVKRQPSRTMEDVLVRTDAQLVTTSFSNENYEFSTCRTTKRCTNLSRAKSFVQDWVNHDCPTLYRYTTNQKNVSVNGFGFTLPVFSNALVDTYDCKFQLDDTLTDKEINALLKHLNPKGAVAEHLNFAKKANEMGQDALWKLREEVKDTCKAINDLLHEPATRDAILKAQTEHQRDAMPMMDCGWLNWFPLEGTEFAEKFNTVRSTGNGPYFLDIDMPIIDQSVNVQSYGGDVVRDLVSKRLGIDIYYVRHLD